MDLFGSFHSPLIVLVEPQLQGEVLEATPAHFYVVLADEAARIAAAPAGLFLSLALPGLGLVPGLLPLFVGVVHWISTPNLPTINSMASSLAMRCRFAIRLVPSFFFLIRYPGLSSVTSTSNPRMPNFGSYFVPGMSMYSLMPNPKLPWRSKFLRLSLFSRACRARLRNSMAGSSRSVTLQPIVRPGLSPQ